MNDQEIGDCNVICKKEDGMSEMTSTCSGADLVTCEIGLPNDDVTPVGEEDTICDEPTNKYKGQGGSVSTKKRTSNDIYSSHSRPPKRTRKLGFDEEMFQETSYVIRDGLRHVIPYNFTFTTYCKGRWIGKKLLDIFEKEFRMESLEYYEKAIRTGKITVNGKIVEPTTIMKHNDILKTKVHRHEQPVVDHRLEIIASDENLVVINKPSSIPVHPCGRFRHNTVVFILGKEMNFRNLHTIHRIDRLTSGLLMFAKNSQKAREMEEQLKSRKVQKIYLCKIDGEFPEETVTCDEPIVVASHNVGVCRVDQGGKACRTVFRRVSFDGKYSIVKCYPATGRMHQIRVHLQWLGYPITNDPIYNHPTAWGPSKGKNGSELSTEKILQGLAETRKDNRAAAHAEFTKETSQPESDISSHGNPGEIRREVPDSDGCSATYDPDCSDCKRPWECSKPDDIIMYLHAWSYKGESWKYVTKVPGWCAQVIDEED